MKTTLLSFMSILFASIGIQAQTDVYLNINHKMGSEAFAFNVAATNNLDNDVKFGRLEYYVSEITVTHDGGLMTAIEDLWILVDAGEYTNINLGNHDVNNVEAVSFFVGVDPDHNHEDPAAYPASHPLAPQNPSMHWGWTAGYRFIALEGVGGAGLNQAVELHGLGDQNYFQNTTQLDASAVSGVVVIDLDADYLRAVENIGLTSGTITHGDYGDAQDCLENMRDYVFSPAGSVVGIEENETSAQLNVYPNPASNGAFWVKSSLEAYSGYDLKVIDSVGKTVFTQLNLSGQNIQQVENLAAGLYTIVILEANGLIKSTKVAVN
jgi:hypothetical protein